MPFNSANTAAMTAAAVTVDILTGREYLRVSEDKSGRRRSVTEQHNDNETTAVRLWSGCK